MPPPTEPGIQYINSKPLIPFSSANSESFFCGQAEPAIIVSGFNFDNVLKLLSEKLNFS